MEYNLQKTLNSDYFDFDSSNAVDFEIEQYDEITPGIGQIVQIDNIIVPIYHTSDLTTIIKDDSSEQLGAGVDVDSTVAGDNELPTNNETIIENSDNELNTNNKKRKVVDDGIHSSFLHPKMFKTKTLSFAANDGENLKTDSMLPKKKKQTLKMGKKL